MRLNNHFSTNGNISTNVENSQWGKMTHQDTSQDTHFLNMVSLICDRHNAEFEVDMENHIVNFITGNVSEQLIEDMMKLFGSYEV